MARIVNWDGVAAELLFLSKGVPELPDDRREYAIKCILQTMSRDPMCTHRLREQDQGPWFGKLTNQDIASNNAAVFAYGGIKIDTGERYRQAQPISPGDFAHVFDWARDLPEDRLSEMKGHQSLRALVYASKNFYKALEKAKLLPQMSKGTRVIGPSLDGMVWVQLVEKEAFENEGKAMGHCIASYRSSSGKCYSLRDADGWPHASAYVRGEFLTQFQARSDNKNYDEHRTPLCKLLGIPDEIKQGYVGIPRYRNPMAAGLCRVWLAPQRTDRIRQGGGSAECPKPTETDDLVNLYCHGYNEDGKQNGIITTRDEQVDCKKFYLAPRVGEEHIGLVPKAINAKYVMIGGPLAQTVLDRLVNRPKTGISICVMCTKDLKIPKRLNIKQLVLAHSKDVRLPKGFSAPIILFNTSLKGHRPEILYNTPRMSLWANLTTQWLFRMAAQTLNEHDVWFPDRLAIYEGGRRTEVNISDVRHVMPNRWSKKGSE